jgi:hypothetical protein
MYPGYRLKVLPRITCSVLLYLHLKPTAGCQMSTSAKKNEDQHLVALSCTLIIYRGLDACSINTVILGITLLFLE